MKEIDITTGIYVTWKNTKTFEFHQLRVARKENL